MEIPEEYLYEEDFDPSIDEDSPFVVEFTRICDSLSQSLDSKRAQVIANAIVSAAASTVMASDVFRVLSKNLTCKLENDKIKYYVRGAEHFDISQYLHMDSATEKGVPVNSRFIQHFQTITDQYKQLGKKFNQGEIGQLATVETYKDFSNGVDLHYTFMDEGLKYIGIDPRQPFTVLGEPSRQSARTMAIPTFSDRDTSAATSKADMIFQQNGNRIGISIKFFGGQDPGIGIWEPTDLHKYIVQHYNQSEDDPQLAMLKHSLERWHQEKTVRGKEPHAIYIGTFLTTQLGKKFLFDILTDTTATCKLHKDHSAQYILSVDKMGRMYFYDPMSYIEMLQSSYIGTCGCGFVLESTASKRGGQLQYRSRKHHSRAELANSIFSGTNKISA